MRGVLVFTAQTAVARHVRVQDGGELAWQAVLHVQMHLSESGGSEILSRGPMDGERTAAMAG
jgi:hypothetical protein